MSFNDRLKNEISLNSDDLRVNSLKEKYIKYGHINNPSKDRHLEFSFDNAQIANDTLNELFDFDINAKLSTRGKKYLVYLKDKKSIMAMLKLLGANETRKEFNNSIENRKLKLIVNRQVNFETANLQKTVSTSSLQIEQIKKILRHLKKDDIDEKLYNVMKFRLKYPDLTYLELAQKIGNISKSTLNRRLNQIKILSEKY